MVAELLKMVIAQCRQTSLIEWFAFIFAVAQVVLALKNKTLNFYAGILSVSLYIYIFFRAGLFAESLLNVYYLVVSIAGIIIWGNKNGQKQLEISKTSKKDWIKAIVLFATLLVFLYIILKSYTSSTVPAADSIATSFAWVGTWLLIRRKLENWIVLTFSNIIAVPLFIVKGLELTALLTIIYIILGVVGYYSWKKAVFLQKANDFS